MSELEPQQPVTPPEQPAQQPEPEPSAVEFNGQKVVPLAALLETREKLAALKEKATKYDEVADWYNQKRAVVEFVEKNPQLLRRDEEPAKPEPKSDPRLTAFAQKFDLYTTDGKPDTARAADIMSMFREEARSVAEEAVKPVHQLTQRDKSQMNYQAALRIQAPDGRRPNPETLAQMFRGMPLEVTSNEEASAALAYAALGYDVVHGKAAPRAPEREPVYTEGLGGGRRPAQKITPGDERIAAIRGLKVDKYTELTKDFAPGQINTLED